MPEYTKNTYQSTVLRSPIRIRSEYTTRVPIRVRYCDPPHHHVPNPPRVRAAYTAEYKEYMYKSECCTASPPIECVGVHAEYMQSTYADYVLGYCTLPAARFARSCAALILCSLIGSQSLLRLLLLLLLLVFTVAASAFSSCITTAAVSAA